MGQLRIYPKLLPLATQWLKIDQHLRPFNFWEGINLKRTITIAIIIIVVVVIGILSALMIQSNKVTKSVRTMPINEVDLTNVSDGVYLGNFSYAGFTYEVVVTVKDKKIEEIKVLKNRNTKYAKIAEGVIEKVIQAQSLKVDAVSGATTTSKALLKAIENALTQQ